MNLLRILSRLRDLGPKKTYERLSDRIHDLAATHDWRNEVKNGTAASSWAEIARAYNFDGDCTLFLAKLKAQPFFSAIKSGLFLNQYLPEFDEVKLKTHAQQIWAGSISIFGKDIEYDLKSMPRWHDDPHCAPSNETARTTFCRDLHVQASWPQNLESRNFDVKYPWERSRLQHLIPLAQLAAQTDDTTYIRHIELELNSWLTHNPFMKGLNWMCTMEVAIRAIGIITIMAHTIDQMDAKLQEKLVCSLYDHHQYIQSFWETSDRPNNHYVADLVGDAYLYAFFMPLNHEKNNLKNVITHASKEILMHFLDDGTVNEGSTAYHRLVIELCLHLQELAHFHNITLPSQFNQMIKLGIQFISACMPNENSLITIGDDDSGTVTTRLKFPAFIPTNLGIQHSWYPHFGVSIIRSDNVFITLRHATYSAVQPTGHFHDDQLSITLYIDGQPLIIDPGSAVYTGNGTVRNLLRSALSHSTFAPEKDIAQTLNLRDLFALPLPSQQSLPLITHTPDLITIASSHQTPNYTATRTLTFDALARTLTLNDQIECRDTRIHEKIAVIWNVMLAPNVTPQQIGFNSSEKWSPFETIVAQGYGQVVPSRRLSTRIAVAQSARMKTTFKL